MLQINSKSISNKANDQLRCANTPVNVTGHVCANAQTPTTWMYGNFQASSDAFFQVGHDASFKEKTFQATYLIEKG